MTAIEIIQFLVTVFLGGCALGLIGVTAVDTWRLRRWERRPRSHDAERWFANELAAAIRGES